VVEPIGRLDGLTEGKVAGQDDVISAEREDQGALHGPRADLGDRGELGHDLLVGQPAQHQPRRGIQANS